MNQHKWISSSAPLNKSILYWQTSQRTASILSPGFLFHAGNGLGNRILGMTTAVYRSMLTNRWLVVYWEPGDNHPVDFSTLFETYPTNPHVPDTTLSIFMTIWSSFSKLLMAIDNHLRYRGYLSYPLSQGSGVCLKPADKHICLPNGANTRFPAKADECELHKTFLQRTWHSFVNYWHTGMEWFMCDEYQVSLYARNGHYRKKLNSWVPSGDYFLEMSRLLFRPRKEFYEWFTGHLRQDANRFWLMDSKHSFRY